MKRNMLFMIVLILVLMPGVSHGFGLMKYFWDGISNQLGFDRGPVPKASPIRPGGECSGKYLEKAPRHVYMQHFYLQANGF
ncbi:MAG: hypothetical protein AB1646_17745 [Thermodesulfobacteriota bacterium]